MPPTDADAALKQMQCPTCGAGQTYADVCRRCKCDLSLVRRLLDQRDALRNDCLVQLRDGQLALALETARRCYELSADRASMRLLAVACFMNGDYAKAVRVHDLAFRPS